MTLNPFRPFWKHLKPYRNRILAGLVLLSVSQLASSAIPLALREAVDLVKEWLDGEHGGVVPSVESVGEQVVFWVLLIVGLALAQMGLEMGMRWCLNSVSRFVEYDIRKGYFKTLLRLSMSYYHRTPTGDLISRATNDMSITGFDPFRNSSHLSAPASRRTCPASGWSRHSPRAGRRRMRSTN